MENTALYVNYYLELVEAGFTHETALLSTVEFMNDQLPGFGHTDWQVRLMLKAVERVCKRIDRLLHPAEEV